MSRCRVSGTRLLVTCVLLCCCSKRSQLSITSLSSSYNSSSFNSYSYLLRFPILFSSWASLTPPHSLSFSVRVITSSSQYAISPSVGYTSLVPFVMRIMLIGILVFCLTILKTSLQVMFFLNFLTIDLLLFAFMITRIFLLISHFPSF